MQSLPYTHQNKHDTVIEYLHLPTLLTRYCFTLLAVNEQDLPNSEGTTAAKADSKTQSF